MGDCKCIKTSPSCEISTFGHTRSSLCNAPNDPSTVRCQSTPARGSSVPLVIQLNVSTFAPKDHNHSSPSQQPETLHVACANDRRRQDQCCSSYGHIDRTNSSSPNYLADRQPRTKTIRSKARLLSATYKRDPFSTFLSKYLQNVNKANNFQTNTKMYPRCLYKCM